MNTETPTNEFQTYPCDKDGVCPQHRQQSAYLVQSVAADNSFEAKASETLAAAKNADWVTPKR